LSLRQLTILVAAGAALCVPAASARAATFSNGAQITINDQSASTPYPSAVAVSGVIGTVTKVTATLNGFHHQCPSDLDMLLVGPHGRDTILMSDTGGCPEPATGPPPIQMTFDDAGPPVPCQDNVPLPAGSYAPTDGSTPGLECSSAPTTPDVFNPPAPPGPYPAGLATFNGVDPNGTWSLYSVDQFAGDDGAIDGGWTLNLTIAPGALTSAPTISGRADVGRTLSATSGALGNGAAASYQWSRCSVAGRSCSAIAGATGSTYKLARADRGHRLVVTETGVTSGGNSAPFASKPTSAVGPAVLSSAGTKKSQNVVRQKGLVVSIKSNIGGTLTATAKAKGARFKTAKKRLRVGRKTTVKLKLSKNGLGSVAGKAKLTLTVRDASGGKAVKRLTIRLR
jgi:hypothetical protein